jgi:hypothetical protein
VYRNNGDSQLKDGDAYIPGEELLVMLYGPKDNGLQFVFETTNGAFVGGGCDNRRVANAKLGKLRTPSDGNGDIMVIAGWALGYDNVKITPPFMLVPGVAEKPDNGKVAETPDANSETQPDPVKHADSGETAPRAQVEPIKLNLRGGKAAMPASDPPAAPSGDIPPAAPKIHVKSTPVKLSVASKTASVTDTPPPPAASQVDPSEPEGAVRNPVKPAATPDAPAESAQEREARLAAEIRAVAAAAAAAEKASAAAERDAEAAEATRRAAAQVAEASAEAERKAAAEAVAEAERKAAAQAALDAAAKLRASPPAAPADETAEAKKHKIQLEDLDRLDAGEDVDVAIEKMQAMIKEMKKKKAAKENVPAEEGEEIEKKVKAKVQKVDRKKKKGKGDILGVGGKKGASGSAKEGFVLKVAARKNRMSAGGEVPAEDADGEVETETENEVEVEEEGEEEKAPEPASQVRARRSKRKRKSWLTVPTYIWVDDCDRTRSALCRRFLFNISLSPLLFPFCATRITLSPN